MAEMEWQTQEELEAERNKKTDFQVLSETQSDLIYTLMMNGVI
jgi:hypothetical protein